MHILPFIKCIKPRKITQAKENKVGKTWAELPLQKSLTIFVYANFSFEVITADATE